MNGLNVRFFAALRPSMKDKPECECAQCEFGWVQYVKEGLWEYDRYRGESVQSDTWCAYWHRWPDVRGPWTLYGDTRFLGYIDDGEMSFVREARKVWGEGRPFGRVRLGVFGWNLLPGE